MVVQNVGHVPNYYTGARNLIPDGNAGPPRLCDADFTVHPESKTRDRAKVLTLNDCKLSIACTTDVAIVRHNKRCKMQTLFDSHSGLLIVRITKPGAAPIIIFGVYLRPGIDNRVAAHKTCNLIRLWHTNLSRKYPGELQLICGDFNSSYIDPNTRFTEDTVNRGHCKLVSELFRDLDFAPVHGRSELTPGQFTSRSLDEKLKGRSEIDFILAPSSFNNFLLCSHQSFNDIEGEGALTHVAIGAQITLPRCQRNRQKAPRQQPDQSERAKPVVVPDWDSLEQYAAAADTIRSELESGSVFKAVGAAAKLEAFQSILANARTQHLDPQSKQQANVEAD